MAHQEAGGIVERVALGLVELDSIARGVFVTDAMVKTAPVELISATHATPGKFVIVIGGGVAEVDSCLAKGLEAGSGHLIDHLFLPHVDLQVFPAIAGHAGVEEIDAVGVVETGTLSSAILAGDAAAKGASIHLLEIKLSRGLHGKGFVTLTGAVSDVEAAVEFGERAARSRGFFVSRAVIARPHEEVARRILSGLWGEIEGQPVL